MKKLVFALLALCAFASCDNGDDIPRKKDRTDIPLTKSEQALADAGNDFAFSLKKYPVHLDSENPSRRK